MESQPQNPEFRNNPENFHPCSGDSPVLFKTDLIFKNFSRKPSILKYFQACEIPVFWLFFVLKGY